ncbi:MULTISPECIES: hypothetical protein [Sphingomonas]|uniref:hypothetical protein n=1 Tax=Sphingomonas TaxID=13687 RepID=UPI001269FF42|nr:MULTISPECIES: hypothetical protein [Sphingomonas]
MSNVIQLPRPRRLRPSPARIGYYLRVGRNDHKEVASRLAEGERAYSGLVFDAHNVERHRELIAAAATYGLDAVLDTRSQQAAFVGGYSNSLGKLPWGLGRQSAIGDFRGAEGQRRAEEIATFAEEHGISAVLAPTHLISSANDPWFAADRAVATRLKAQLPRQSALFYSLALPFQLLRNTEERGAIVEALRSVDMDALWIKVENFGADASGEKVRAFVNASQDFHQLGVPVVVDHAGGLPGLATLAFGATGGIAHGIMMFESFKASAWRHPRGGTPRVPAPRVYLQGLDMLVAKDQASNLLEHSLRVRGQHACRDPRCCPRGYRDMVEHPARHYCYSRARQVEMLSSTPIGGRASAFMDEMVRPRSDALAAAATLPLTDEKLVASLAKRHLAMGRFRGALADMTENFEPLTVAQCPLSRQQREE